jgi:hypothetical protein
MNHKPFSGRLGALLLTVLMIVGLNAQPSAPGLGPLTNTSPIVLYHLTFSMTVSQRP